MTVGQDKQETQKLMRLIGMVARRRKMPGPITEKDLERERQRQLTAIKRKGGN